jgi:PIN domain nuclease of toxin-antitoxin system
MPYVIDASVLMALLRREPGWETAEIRAEGATMSAVNASEALMRSVEKGFTEANVLLLIADRQIAVAPFDAELAVSTARLRPATKRLGLSFADQGSTCLARSN